MNRQFKRRFSLTDIIVAIIVIALASYIVLYKNGGDQAPSPTVGNQLSGHPHVIDGDSIRLHGTEMRLIGMDAPELYQFCDKNGTHEPCGQQSKEYLIALINGNTVECRWDETDRFHRALAKCYVNNQLLNRQMVLDGWAVSFYNYPHEERLAKRQKRGIWASKFERPRNWRRNHPRSK